MEELGKAMPGRRVVLARELTKKFEEWLRGTPAELAAELARRPRKGEFVVLVGPGDDVRAGSQSNLPEAIPSESEPEEAPTGEPDVGETTDMEQV